MRRIVIAGIAAAGIAAGLAAQPVNAATPARQVAPASVGPFRFTLIQYNSPGGDHGDNPSVNAEWVKITNITSEVKPLTGFHVHDLGFKHRYTFGPMRLGPHKSVFLHSGIGHNGPVHRYWGEGYYVWNNDKDTATLTGPTGVVADVCAWNDPEELHSRKVC